MDLGDAENGEEEGGDNTWMEVWRQSPALHSFIDTFRDASIPSLSSSSLSTPSPALLTRFRLISLCTKHGILLPPRTAHMLSSASVVVREGADRLSLGPDPTTSTKSDSRTIAAAMADAWALVSVVLSSTATCTIDVAPTVIHQTLACMFLIGCCEETVAEVPWLEQCTPVIALSKALWQSTPVTRTQNEWPLLVSEFPKEVLAPFLITVATILRENLIQPSAEITTAKRRGRDVIWSAQCSALLMLLQGFRQRAVETVETVREVITGVELGHQQRWEAARQATYDEGECDGDRTLWDRLSRRCAAVCHQVLLCDSMRYGAMCCHRLSPLSPSGRIGHLFATPRIL